MNIPPSDFRWYAAFHDEGSHPHIHMMAWSVKPGQAYLSKDGIRKIKSALTNDIFKQEMLHTYEQKSASRDELVCKAREEMTSLVQEMQTSIGSHPEVESLMMTLATQLETVKGKKKYGYLPKAVKKTVDEIVDQMEQLPVIDECYQVWWEFQCQIEDFYSERERLRPPLSEQKEFRSIKNAVIQEAENIRIGKVIFEDEEMEEATDSFNLSYDCWELWMVTQDDTAPMVDRDEAAAQLISKAESGDPSAQYLVGKLYQDGPVLIPDSVEARYWFDQSARQGYTPAQYALGKLYLSDDTEVCDPVLGVQWLEYAARNGSNFAAYHLGKAVAEKLLFRNPADGCRLPSAKAREMQVLTPEEIQRLLIQAKEDNRFDLLLLELSTGLRRGEICALQWDDLNLRTGELRVQRQVHRIKSKLVASPPKTKAGNRSVILPVPVLGVLKAYKKTVNSRWMFPSPVSEDSPRDPAAVRKRLQTVLERAECKKIRFHDLRHTFSTCALEHGMDVKTLSTIIGHISSSTTLNIYSHVTNEMRRTAAVKIDQGIGNVEIQPENQAVPRKPAPSTFQAHKGRRRKAGTGRVTQINEKLWEGRYSPIWPDGKKHPRNIYAHSEEECEKLLAKMIAEMKTEIAAERERLKAG